MEALNAHALSASYTHDASQGKALSIAEFQSLPGSIEAIAGSAALLSVLPAALRQKNRIR